MQYNEPVKNIILEFDSATRNKLSWTRTPFVVFSVTLNGYICIPKNFYHDRASHPAKWFGMEAGLWSLEQQVSHDWLYETGLYLDLYGNLKEIPRTDAGRKLADEVLFELLQLYKGEITAITWYAAVRLRGKKRWYGPDRPQKRIWVMPTMEFTEKYYERWINGIILPKSNNLA